MRTLLRALAAPAWLLLSACSSILHLPDGARYSTHDGSRSAVVQQGQVRIDGSPAASRFDGILKDGVAFSEDGSRHAYIGMRGDKFFLVVDGREHGPFDGVVKGGVKMTPSGRRVALPIVQGGRWHLWLDGKLSRGHDGIAVGHPLYPADESRVLYGALDNGRWSLVMEGVELPLGDSILSNDFGFTTTGEPYAAYRREGTWRVQLGDATSEAFDAIMQPGLMHSASGRTIGFIAKRGPDSMVCVQLVCGRLHRAVGTQVPLEGSAVGDLTRDILIGGVLAGVVSGLSGANVHMLSTPSGGGVRSTIYGSLVFSPDDRHHAYVAHDKVVTIVADGSVLATLADGELVDWMKFDESSQVLMVRYAGEATLRALPLPDTRRMPPGDAAGAATLTISASNALVFVDERYTGVSPQEVTVAPGLHRVRIQGASGRSTSTEVQAAAGQRVQVGLEAPDDAQRAAVRAAIASFDNGAFLPAKVDAGKLLYARMLAAVPIWEDTLGVVTSGSGPGALIFGGSAIYVHNSHSSKASGSETRALSYAQLVRGPRTSWHPLLEVPLTPDLNVLVAGLNISQEKLIALVELLRTRLAALPPAR